MTIITRAFKRSFGKQGKDGALTALVANTHAPPAQRSQKKKKKKKKRRHNEVSEPVPDATNVWKWTLLCKGDPLIPIAVDSPDCAVANREVQVAA